MKYPFEIMTSYADKKLKLDKSKYDSTGHKILRTSNRTGDRRAEATQHRDAEKRNTDPLKHGDIGNTVTRKHTEQSTENTKNKGDTKKIKDKITER